MTTAVLLPTAQAAVEPQCPKWHNDCWPAVPSLDGSAPVHRAHQVAVPATDGRIVGMTWERYGDTPATAAIRVGGSIADLNQDALYEMLVGAAIVYAQLADAVDNPGRVLDTIAGDVHAALQAGRLAAA